MNYNYHTHTYRCHHATGKIEEYIQRAIDNGITHMGFSDHFPYICTDGTEGEARVRVSEAYEYVSEIDALRKKYKNKIDIKIGFEMEYYPEFFEKMINDAIDYGAEYLILGEHYIQEESPNGIHTFEETCDEDFLSRYAECVISAIKSGYFTYVAHPDGIRFTGDDFVYEKYVRKICKASKEYNIPLELNFLGIRDNRHYPNLKFWKIAGEEKCPVTFGFDAHTVKSAYNGKSLPKAKEIVEMFGLNYIGKPDIVLIQDKFNLR
ncbi:MAG: histidinol-phosphatase HisJ family protein [Ruminococcaceae bacterium]|nr:histidinol-phosphatase HisJ family protein [Oscillospiraceae bacterium]